jgi:hypothetical protein
MNILTKKLLLVFFLTNLLLISCEKVYENPYDPNTDPNIWMPKNLELTILNNNLANISWEQNENRIDGFVLKNRNHPSTLPIYIGKDDSSFIDSSIFILESCGFHFNYSLQAYAAENFSTELVYDSCLDPPVPPSITTVSISNLTSSSIDVVANITENGGTQIIQRGICFDTVSNPDLINSPYTNDGNSSGQFTSNISNLSSNTTYFVRAYALNYADTGYGNEMTFTTLTESVPILTTNIISNITDNSAQSGGDITSNGNSNITSRGVCWSTSSSPTISNNITNDGNGTGNFLSNMNNLNSNTTYYVRAYATNSIGTAYGNELSFTTTTLSVPSLTTSSISNITANSAQSGGNVTSDGNSTVNSKGICWSTSPNPTNGNVNFMTIDGTGTGSFSSNLTNLSSNTTYYVRAYASNSVGTAYGNELTFTTPIVTSLATISTTSASSVTANSALTGGNITNDGNASVTSRGICWGTSTNPTTSNNITNDGSGTGIFASSISNLLHNTTYYARAYAVNSVGTAYGNQISFTTPGLWSSIGQISGITENNDAMLILGTNNVWFVGSNVWNWNGSSFNPISSPSSNNLIAVGGTSSTNIWVLDNNNGLWKWNGSSWQSFQPNCSSCNFKDIIIDGNNIILGGYTNGGTDAGLCISTDNGLSWYLDEPCSNSSQCQDYTDMDGTNINNIWITTDGSFGIRGVRIFNGLSWSQNYQFEDIGCISTSGPNNAFITQINPSGQFVPAIWKFDTSNPTGWVNIQLPSQMAQNWYYTPISTISPNETWFGSDKIYKFNGSSWIEESGTISNDIKILEMFDSNNGYAVSGSGNILFR